MTQFFIEGKNEKMIRESKNKNYSDKIQDNLKKLLESIKREINNLGVNEEFAIKNTGNYQKIINKISKNPEPVLYKI